VDGALAMTDDRTRRSMPLPLDTVAEEVRLVSSS
jgi:hypothetical protein